MARRTVAERFWQKVNKGTWQECWYWTGAKVPRGYGSFGVGYRDDGSYRVTSAHRYSWEMHNGPIPGGLQVCHHCDNRLCVNPAHLFLGTNAENQADCVRKGRQCQGVDKHNAKLTEDDVREIRRLHFEEGHGHRKLGRAFGIMHSQVGKILRRELWAHVK